MSLPTLSSVQRRLLREQEEDVLDVGGEAPKGEAPPKKPEKGAEKLEDIPELGLEPTGEPEENGAPGAHTGDETHRVKRTIDAVKKLQDAAVGLEAARFAIANEYSDFALAAQLEALKSELVSLIGKAKEHIMKSSSKSPDAEELVADWLK